MLIDLPFASMARFWAAVGPVRVLLLLALLNSCLDRALLTAAI